MTCRVYVAAPFASGRDLRARLLGRFSAIGVECVSSWLFKATGEPEDLSPLSLDDIQEIAECNDDELRWADVVLLVDPEGKGRETYSEARIALEWGKPVVWYGRHTLSAYRGGVFRVNDLDEAMELLRAFAEDRVAWKGMKL